MERAISEMERIKRAEEIYSKRKNPEEADIPEKKIKSLYKNLFQILLLIDVAVGIVAFQNREYIFSSEFIQQVNSYNINVKEKIESLTNSSKENENVVEQNITETGSTENTEIQEENVIENNSEAEIGVGGALVENEAVEELSQMELDAKSILENYSVILPVQGTKTSGFGERESNNIVTPNHTGVDIGAATGTVIRAAHSGIVTQVSSQGDYGKHLRITNNDLVTLYAHCSKIYVSEGQEVVQGQEIAEVGSTGNSTGPHLHFGIIYQERYVDPELIIEI